MKHQEEFAIGGMVSVWVGNFADDVHFDDYMNLSRDFETDFGFRINDRDVREPFSNSLEHFLLRDEDLSVA